MARVATLHDQAQAERRTILIDAWNRDFEKTLVTMRILAQAAPPLLPAPDKAGPPHLSDYP